MQSRVFGSRNEERSRVHLSNEGEGVAFLGSLASWNRLPGGWGSEPKLSLCDMQLSILHKPKCSG